MDILKEAQEAAVQTLTNDPELSDDKNVILRKRLDEDFLNYSKNLGFI
jgi:hypothetical protein